MPKAKAVEHDEQVGEVKEEAKPVKAAKSAPVMLQEKGKFQLFREGERLYIQNLAGQLITECVDLVDAEKLLADLNR